MQVLPGSMTVHPHRKYEQSTPKCLCLVPPGCSGCAHNLQISELSHGSLQLYQLHRKLKKLPSSKSIPSCSDLPACQINRSIQSTLPHEERHYDFPKSKNKQAEDRSYKGKKEQSSSQEQEWGGHTEEVLPAAHYFKISLQYA